MPDGVCEHMFNDMVADLRQILADLREFDGGRAGRDEALEQQATPTEILHVVHHSSGDLAIAHPAPATVIIHGVVTKEGDLCQRLPGSSNLRGRRKSLFSISAALFVLLLAWMPSAMGQSINLGVLTDMKGIYSALSGEGSVEAARMAAEDFGGSVLGKQIRVLVGDHQQNVETATRLATGWFDNDQVGAILDMPNSTIALAGQKLAADRGKISITVSAATTELTGTQCRETTFHWAWDTYSHSMNLAPSMVGFGLDTWFFITADYAFGWNMEQLGSNAVTAAGGRVLGAARHPLNAVDFGPFVTAALDSNAKVIAVANAGGDTINTIRQAAELGVSPRSQTLAPLVVFISDIHALGLDTAKGMTFIDGFYWDKDDETRRWSKRFFDRRGAIPTMTHAGVYSGALHYLRAVQLTNSDDGKKVAAKMRELPVDDFFAQKGEVRANGRMAHDMYLVQVKRPEESLYPWDYYKILRTIPGSIAFQPVAETGCPLVTNVTN
jgi:branched-chain amino acid transport system substrate-binding protein